MSQTRNKPVVSYTLDQEVVDRVSSLADALGVSDSSFVNMQLRCALGMIDSQTADYIEKGNRTTRITEVAHERL